MPTKAQRDRFLKLTENFAYAHQRGLKEQQRAYEKLRDYADRIGVDFSASLESAIRILKDTRTSLSLQDALRKINNPGQATFAELLSSALAELWRKGKRFSNNARTVTDRQIDLVTQKYHGLSQRNILESADYYDDSPRFYLHSVNNYHLVIDRTKKSENPGLVAALLEGAAGAVGGAVIEKLAEKRDNYGGRNEDIWRQGFMKRRKPKVETMYQIWDSTDTNLLYNGKSKEQANQVKSRHKGSILKTFKIENPHFPGKLGTGQRFAECVSEMETRPGVYDPEGLCAYIGRRKFGKRDFARLANPQAYGLAELYDEARALGREIGEKHERRDLREPSGAALERMAENSLSRALRTAACRQTSGQLKSFDKRYAMGVFKAAYRKTRGTVNPGILERVETFFRLDNDSDCQKAKKLSSAFHGRENREIYEFDEIIDDDRHLAHLGNLTELHIKANKGKPFIITFDENPILAATPDAKQLVFVGGDQGLDLDDKVVQSGNMFIDGANARGKRWIPIGEVSRIDYFADKHHLEGPKEQKDGVEYKHKFGEEDGNLPVLMYSPVNERMMLAGGNYEVLDVGIKN